MPGSIQDLLARAARGRLVWKAWLFLVVLLAAMRGAHAERCHNCFAFPNGCPLDRPFPQSAVYSDIRGTCSTSDNSHINLCCPVSIPAGCNLVANGAAGCCSFRSSFCNRPSGCSNGLKRYMLSTNAVARAAANGNNRCTPNPQCQTNSPVFVCPPNYQLSVPFTYTVNNPPSNWDDFNIRFCTPDNCQFSYAGDCTTCFTCISGYFSVPDGSCQKPPLISGSVRAVRTGAFTAICPGVTLITTTDAGVATAAVTVGGAASGQGAQSGVANAVASITNVSCWTATTPAAVLLGADNPRTLTFNFGLSPLTCVARDSNNLVTTCVTTVNVTDVERPSVFCGNLQVPALPNNSSALFAWSRQANATDNVAVDPVRSVCTGGPANNLFPFNSPTPINCMAFDTSGNSNPCSYTITVVDRTAPALTCPASATFNTTLNSNTRTHTYVVGVFDNVDGSSPAVTCSNPSGSQFLIGTTRVTCQAVDVAGNVGVCSFNVTVVDRQPPTLNCPASFSPSSDATSPSATILLNATATDNSLGPVTLVCTPGGLPSVFAFPLGTTPVTCVATDMFGNSISCSYPVIVVDRVPPVLSCPAVTLVNLPGRNFSNISSYPATATDNVNVTSFVCSPSVAGFRYPIGSTSVTCTAGDARGNTQSCTFSVNVVDDETPLVTCPASFRNGTLNSTNITVTFPRPVASDNLAVTSSSLVVTFNQVDVALLPNATSYIFPTWGTAAFTYRAMDAAGHTGLCFWTVTLFDRTLGADEIPPNITGCPTPFLYYTPPSADFNSYPSNVTLWVFNTSQGKDSAVLTLAPLSATDNSGVAPTVSYLEWSVNPTSASLGLLVGQHVVAYSATDRVGNAAYCVYLIRVDDVIAPQFESCPTSTELSTRNFQTTVNPADFNYWPSTGIRFTDNFRITNRFGTCVSSPAGFCPLPGTPLNQSLNLGTYNFTYTATDDAGNAATPCRFSLRIKDGDNPVLNGCPTSMSVPIQTPTDPGLATASISSRCPNFTITDNFPGSTLLYYSSPLEGYNCSTPIPVVSPLVITVKGQDASGLSSNFCFLIITVTDNDPPKLAGCSTTTPLIINAVCDPNQRTAVVWLPTITGTDNAGAVTLSLTSFPAGFTNGSAFPMGTTSLTMTATDPNRLTAQCSLEVRVRDTQPPVILGFPVANATTFSYSFVTDLNQPTYAFTLPALSARDNVAVQSTSLTYEPAITNNNFPVGRTTLTFIAYDTSSLSSSVTIFVNVRDTQPPNIIGCPTVGNATPTVWVYNTSLNQPTAVVSWNTIYAQDNVDGEFPLSPTSVPGGFESGSPFRVGTTTITYQAIDVAGNINNCVFRVQVVDNQAPKIACPDNVTMTTASADTTYAVLTWPLPVATDNYHLQPIEPNMFPNQNYTVGTYNITYVATDLAGNTNSCTFFATVLQFVPAAAASSSSSSAATFGAAGGAGALLLLLLLLVFIVVLTRRRNKKKLQAAASGYAELMKMSDDFILERAKSIQDALMEQRMASPPAAVNAQYIHPERKFAAPPTGLAALEDYMRSAVNKELSRALLEFGAELGAGEFGAVYEGFYLQPNPKLKVAIKMLKKATSDEDKCRFLKEAAIMAQFNHPNICSLVGVCTLPTTEPTLIVLEYMHLGALHGYLQSPMVYEKLETLTMLRMALDVGCGMQYLAEAGFVHRDLAARNILLDKTMTCRIGDFGLSVDLSEGEGEDSGVYSGQEGAKIPIRWTAIEAVCFRQFSTASDVWSYGVLLWEIWSYAELPYRGWSNKKVTEEVSAGFRLPKPAHCPDEVYRIMIDCWNKNVKRRATFPKINQALVEIWHEITRGDRDDDEDGPNAAADDDAPADGNMLYDNSATQMAPDSSDDDEDGPAPAAASAKEASAPNPPVVDDDDVYQIDEPTMVSSTATAVPASAAAAAEAFVQEDDEEYVVDTKVDPATFAISIPGQTKPEAAAPAAPAADPVYLYSSSVQPSAAAVAAATSPDEVTYVTDLKELTKNVNTKALESTAEIYSESAAIAPVTQPTPRPGNAQPMQIKAREAGFKQADVGERVVVKDFGPGVLRFYGPHAKDGKPRCGVELDEPKGLNNGTAGGHKYFECEVKRGVLVDPRVVLLAKPKAVAIMFNPIYDSVTIFRPTIVSHALADDGSAEQATQRSGYLQIGENLEP